MIVGVDGASVPIVTPADPAVGSREGTFQLAPVDDGGKTHRFPARGWAVLEVPTHELETDATDPEVALFGHVSPKGAGHRVCCMAGAVHDCLLGLDCGVWFSLQVYGAKTDQNSKMIRLCQPMHIC